MPNPNYTPSSMLAKFSTAPRLRITYNGPCVDCGAPIYSGRKPERGFMCYPCAHERYA